MIIQIIRKENMFFVSGRFIYFVNLATFVNSISNLINPDDFTSFIKKEPDLASAM